MPKGKGDLPDKTEERGLLSKVIALAPLLTLALQFLELVLKILGLIN
ncbi:hypothetical protein LJC31_06470 [Synergistaceae bacterium OttesenSCG-928-I11]|nr:hypothetical protein [Synergistaceae bacterium OttesenSCG-928-I11]